MGGVALVDMNIPESIHPVGASIGISAVAPHQHFVVSDPHISDQALGIGHNGLIEFEKISLFDVDPFFILTIDFTGNQHQQHHRKQVSA